MRLSTFTYCLKEGMKNIGRNIWFSLASTAIISACIFLFCMFFALVANVQYMVKNAETTVGITVFFDENMAEADILAIGKEIAARKEIKETKYISAEEAWETFQKEYFKDAEELAEGFADDNPLAGSASYEIYLKDIADQDVIVSYLNTITGIRKINYSNDTASGLSTFNKMLGLISAVIIAILLAVAVFCGLAEGVYAGKREGGLQAVQMAGALAVTALSVSDMQTMIGLGRQTIEQMDGFAGLLLPVVAVLTAATGAATGAAVRQGATVLFSDLLIGAIDTLLVPIVYAYVAVCAAHAAVGNEGLKKLASVLKWVVTSLLTAVLLAFVGYLTASGAIAGSADAAAIKTAKMAISRAVPVVGGILADAAETVLVGAGVLRGTVGIVGMLGVLAICLIPFLQLAFHYLTYKLAAALIGAVSDKRLSDLLDSIGGAFGIVLGMTGACALMLLVSLASAVKAVTP